MSSLICSVICIHLEEQSTIIQWLCISLLVYTIPKTYSFRTLARLELYTYNIIYTLQLDFQLHLRNLLCLGCVFVLHTACFLSPPSHCRCTTTTNQPHYRTDRPTDDDTTLTTTPPSLLLSSPLLLLLLLLLAVGLGQRRKRRRRLRNERQRLLTVATIRSM